MSDELAVTAAPTFQTAGRLEDLDPTGKLVVSLSGIEVLLLRHDDQIVALANLCIHRDRALAQGFLLKGRIVCPGHQWSFSLEDGYCKERDRTQPVYEVRIVDDEIQVAI